MNHVKKSGRTIKQVFILKTSLGKSTGLRKLYLNIVSLQDFLQKRIDKFATNLRTSVFAIFSINGRDEKHLEGHSLAWSGTTLSPGRVILQFQLVYTLICFTS